MATSKKLSKQEFRQLMREKVQSKKDIRIDSPLAKYDDQNQLWCRVCNQIISSDLLWSTHLIGKAHKKKVEELKHKKSKSKTSELMTLTTAQQISPLKRTLNNQEEVIPNKISKSSSVSPVEIVSVTEKKLDLKQQTVLNDVNFASSSSLPQDFFDDGFKLVEQNSQETKEFNNKIVNDKQSLKTLPKGFFDDPLLEAKARKIPYNEHLDAQFELFRKEIAEESLISQNMIEEEIEELEREKTLTEINEQLENWAKVDQIQKKIEDIHKKQAEVDNDMMEDDVDSDQSDDQIDLNDMNFWRNKDVFL